MTCCFNVACFFCTLCAFIGLASLVQLCVGIYLTFIQTDIININHLIKTDNIDSYLAYILFIFIGLGFISLVLTLISNYGMAKRNRPLSLFVAVLWVFTVAINLVMLTILLSYYYLILPQLRLSLVHSLKQLSPITKKPLDFFQSKYECCGINNIYDYQNVSFPSSCCRVLNCLHDIDVKNDNNSNNTISLMHNNGCYPMIDRYVTIELWIIAGVIGACILLQIIAITFMCIANQRYEKFDDNQKFVISHLGTEVSFNENVNNSNNNNIQGSSKTIEEIVETTQI